MAEVMKGGEAGAEQIDELTTIAAEIKLLEASMMKHLAEHAWQIGKRLCDAKEKLPHGSFIPFIKSTLSYTPQYARNFMRVYTDSPNGISSFHLPSLRHLFEVFSLPKGIDRQEFVETTHTIPSTGETKTVEEMTVRELREVKKALKAEQRERMAQRDADILRDKLESIDEKEPEIRKKFSKLVPILGGFLGMYSEWRK